MIPEVAAVLMERGLLPQDRENQLRAIIAMGAMVRLDVTRAGWPMRMQATSAQAGATRSTQAFRELMRPEKFVAALPSAHNNPRVADAQSTLSRSWFE